MMHAATYDFIFYGDDFTGSTDALEFLVKFGTPAILFLDVPDQAMLDRFPNIKAFGVAGATRSMPTDVLKQTLEQDLQKLGSFNPKFLHYKVCSTFDSSTTIGSIGAVLETAKNLFKPRFIPVLGGMPLIGRYCCFGNVFVRMGIGTDGMIYRLDRHPSMMHHPVTPATESDLRLLIAHQSSLTVSSINIEQMKHDVENWKIHTDDEVIVVDAMDVDHMKQFQQWLDHLYDQEMIFTLGSSGIEAAYSMIHGDPSAVSFTSSANPQNLPILVVSGSQSQVTHKQIQQAAANGFKIISVSTELLERKADQFLLDDIITSLQNGQDVLVYSGDRQLETIDSRVLGTWYGELVKEIASTVAFDKLVICGGDTSSYVARAMQIEAVEIVQLFVPGAPICKTYSSIPYINQLNINVKGGQVGGPNYLLDIKSI